MLTEFILYLTEQLGEPYLWGGQHTKLTPENYVEVITRKETDLTHRADAIAFCKKKFDAGADVLYAYDCSGLGCYWLYNLKHLYKGDVTANTMKNRCELVETPPKRGYWLFKLSGKKAVHVGYMVSDTELIEAAGRKYGVVKRDFKAKDWSCWGIPAVFRDEIVEPQPVPPEPEQYVKVVGNSVNVRKSDSKAGRCIGVAHKGDRLPYIETAPTGWYHVRFHGKEGFITNLEKYTRLEGIKNENEQ